MHPSRSYGRSFALAVLALASACGSPGLPPGSDIDAQATLDAGSEIDAATDDAGTTSGPPVTFADFPHEAGRANCRLLFACCTTIEISGVFTPGVTVTTEAECVSYFEMQFASQGTVVQPYLDMGRLSWDPLAAGDCIATIDEASCPEILGGADIAAGALVRPMSSGPSGVPACNAVFVPHIDIAEQCYFDAECTSGFCADVLGTRSCAVPPGEDEPCTSRCGAGLYCDSRSASPRCRIPGANGAPCTPGTDEACTSGSCNSGTCGPRAPLTLCGTTV